MSLSQEGAQDRLTLSGASEQVVALTRNQDTQTRQVTNQGEEEPPVTQVKNQESIQAAIEESRQREDERLSEIARELNDELNQSLSLKVKRDEETGISFFQLVNPDGEVVRQVPAKEILEFRKKFQEVSGLLFSKEA